MRIYHLNLLVHNKQELSAEELYQATALVRAECPFESLFFLQNHLLETDWVSSGNEEITIASTSVLETELQSHQLKEWREITDPTFLFRIENFTIEEDTLALSA